MQIHQGQKYTNLKLVSDLEVLVVVCCGGEWGNTKVIVVPHLRSAWHHAAPLLLSHRPPALHHAVRKLQLHLLFNSIYTHHNKLGQPINIWNSRARDLCFTYQKISFQLTNECDVFICIWYWTANKMSYAVFQVKF